MGLVVRADSRRGASAVVSGPDVGRFAPVVTGGADRLGLRLLCKGRVLEGRGPGPHAGCLAGRRRRDFARGVHGLGLHMGLVVRADSRRSASAVVSGPDVGRFAPVMTAGGDGDDLGFVGLQAEVGVGAGLCAGGILMLQGVGGPDVGSFRGYLEIVVALSVDVEDGVAALRQAQIAGLGLVVAAVEENAVTVADNVHVDDVVGITLPIIAGLGQLCAGPAVVAVDAPVVDIQVIGAGLVHHNDLYHHGIQLRDLHSLRLRGEQLIGKGRGVGTDAGSQCGRLAGDGVDSVHGLGQNVSCVVRADRRRGAVPTVRGLRPGVGRRAPAVDVGLPLGIEGLVCGEGQGRAFGVGRTAAVGGGVPAGEFITISGKAVVCDRERASAELVFRGNLTRSAVGVIAQGDRQARGPEVDVVVVDVAVPGRFREGIVVGLAVVGRGVLVGNALDGNISDGYAGRMLVISLRPLIDRAV